MVKKQLQVGGLQLITEQNAVVLVVGPLEALLIEE